MRAMIVRAAFAMAAAVAVAGTVAAPEGGAPASAASLPRLTFTAPRAIASPHGTTITFGARLSAASRKAVSVHYATADGTAVAGTDYHAASGTLKIAAGKRSGSVAVRLLPVAFGAGGSNKTFLLRLSNVSGARLPKSSAAGTIHPNVYVTTFSGYTFGHVVIDPSGTTAYLTVPDKNRVAVVNLKTGFYRAPIFVGSGPQGIDITPDGTTLYVCDSGGQTISRVVIATRKVTTITTPSVKNQPNNPFSIAVISKDHALYTTTTGGSGAGGLAYNLNLRTGVSRLASNFGLNARTSEISPVSRSADRSILGVMIGNDTGGDFAIDTVATGKVVSGSLGEAITSSSLDSDGTTMLTTMFRGGNFRGGVHVIDAASGADLGTIDVACSSSVLDRTGSTGYCLEDQALARLNVGRFLVTKTVSLPPTAGGKQLAYSIKGHVLVAETTFTVTIIET